MRERLDFRGWAIGLLAGLALGPTPALGQGAEYTFGVGDVLKVVVWQREDLGGEVVVDAEGNVVLPLIGTIRALGQTPDRLGTELTRRFSFVDRSVSQVTVTVAEYNSRRVFVMGEVVKPGSYAFPRIPGVWEVLREAGGPTATAALARVRVIPPEGEGPPVVIDLERILSTGDFSQLPSLVPGSTILVPRLEVLGVEGDVVHVYGSVNRPGTFPIDAAKTALQAILAAGGPNDKADLRQVRVVRPGPVQARVIEIDLEDYTHDGVLMANVALLPGDTVTVPADDRVFAWQLLREVASISGNILGTIFFFIKIGDENTTTTDEQAGAAAVAVQSP